MIEYIALAFAIIAVILLAAVLIAQKRRDEAMREFRQDVGQTIWAIDNLQGSMRDLRQLSVDSAMQEETRFERLRVAVEGSTERLRSDVGQQTELMRGALENKLSGIQRDNQEKLELIRATVDEKLSATLNRRLGESFTLVNERLEAVYMGLGEMQSLAVGVGDLKNVLTNVKTRGIWGEVQLDNLLAQIMSPAQYEKNAALPGAGTQTVYVDFAIVLPGQGDSRVLIPIDAKFPLEDYQRIIDASELGIKAEIDDACAALERAVRLQAKSIRDKYIQPPLTTDFACMYLPVEGLYAEVLRRPGLCEALQREYKVVVAGPATVSALLNSLQIGFRTLAIEKHAGKVWELLGAVKSEFGKFAGILEKTHKNLTQAVNTIDDAARKTRTIERRLRDVETIGPERARDLLGDAAFEPDDTDISIPS